MIRKIKIPKDYALSKIFFFEEVHADRLPDPRVVPLFGPNGIGKSTLIRAIGSELELEAAQEKYKKDKDYDLYKDIFEKDHRKKGCIIERTKEPLKVYSYINKDQNLKTQRSKNDFDPFFFSEKMLTRELSEGQAIVYSAFDLFEILKPGKEDSVRMENGEILVMIDEIDSGLSIDNLDMFMRKIKYILRKREDVQFIFSFNNPRVLKFFPEVLSLYDGNPVTLHSDEDMLDEMRKHKKMFNKARRRSDGRPKIHESTTHHLEPLGS